MIVTTLTLALFALAYLVSRVVVRVSSPSVAAALIIALAVVSALLMPTDNRVPPWVFPIESNFKLALYLASEFAFFTMGGVAVFLAQRMRGGRA